VIDGHGGRAAVDYVAENLGKNIVKGLQNVGCKGDGQLEEAIRGGYLVTDKEFLSQVNFQLSIVNMTYLYKQY
jgi:protein phosphatase 1L